MSSEKAFGGRAQSERAGRGTIKHRAEQFGESALGVPLEVYLPRGRAKYLICAAQHGDEPETTVVLSHALRAIAADDLVGIGRTNDAVLYGGDVTLWVRDSDEELARMAAAESAE